MDFTWQFLNMLLILLLVCAGAVVALKFFLPRWMGNRRWNRDNHFDLIARYALDMRRALYLVRVGKRYFVFGGADQGVNLLAELSPSELEELKK